MTRAISSLKSLEQPIRPVSMYPRIDLARVPRVCAHRPAPDLEVLFPRDNLLRREAFGGKTAHPAMMHFGLALGILELYTEPGAVVLDPFGGVGTTALAAMAAGRSAILMEIEPHWAEVATGFIHKLEGRKLYEALEYRRVVPRAQLRWVPTPALVKRDCTHTASAVVHNIDARDIPRGFVPNQVQAVITSPPYLDTFGAPEKPKILCGSTQHSAYTMNHASLNLARERNTHFFLQALAQVYSAALHVLEPGGVFIVVTKDVIRKGLRQPFALRNILMLEALGLELRDWWRRECIPSLFANVQRVQYPNSARVDHEDVLVFQKPLAVIA